jgi:hypothetical protein
MTIDGSSSPSSASSITLLLNGAGSLHSVSSLTLLRRGTLEVYDASGLTSGRLSSATAMNLSGGTLSITGPASATANESLGPLFVAGGNSTIDLVDGTGGAVDLTFSSFSLATGATLTLELTSSSDRLFFTTPPSEPRGFIQGVDLIEAGVTSLHVQYSPTLGVVPYGTPGAGVLIGGSDSTGIPEPDGATLCLAATSGLLGRRRRFIP